VQYVLVYAAETWTLLAVNSRDLEAFHMTRKRSADQMASIHLDRWDLHNHWSPINLRNHQLSLQCPLCPRGQAVRRRSGSQGTQLPSQL